MLAGLIQFIHVVVCVGLIVIVLLQADKGEGLAGAFGGGASSTVFGERGAGGFMSKLTTSMAIIFMITSLIISVYVPRWQVENPVSSSGIELSSPAAPEGAPEGNTPTPALPGAPIAPIAPTGMPIGGEAAPTTPAPTPDAGTADETPADPDM
ncbi:MAG: preprotein translocase subunit SecG [Candidatus Rifleibacteriota bacterium]